MDTKRISRGKPPNRHAFTIIELLLVVGIGVILAAVAFSNLFGRKNLAELDGVVRQVVSLLREAQVRSINQASSTPWGVHLENATSNPYYSLFMTSTYSTETRIGFYPLSANIRYATTSLPVGSSTEVIFAQLTGTPSISSTITFELVSGGQVSATGTVTVSGSGLIMY
ncbi:MAG: type II secretion system protein [Patescibacteria group bacterium]